MRVILLSILFNIWGSLEAVSPEKVRTLYSSLDPQSVSQHLAFYDLFPETAEGQASLREAWNLLSGGSISGDHAGASVPPSLAPFIQLLVALVNKQAGEIAPEVGVESRKHIEQLGRKLKNRSLKGYYVEKENEVLLLPPEEIDLARGLLLSELGEEGLGVARSYEAVLDLMALQILTKISLDSLPEEKVRAINHFIFEEMGYRFPPHSVYAKNIDLYTFLPSVVDSRKGVCLGVSILYLCLAQRLGLPMEMITPPGHIYVRYREGDEVINIETTSRGIHIDSEEYLGMNTRSLQKRNIKEVIGLAYFNQASVYFQSEDYKKALECYARAELYLPEDMHLKELMAYNYLLDGQKDKAVPLLKQVAGHIPDHAVGQDTIAQDCLEGIIDSTGIQAIFARVDEKRESILKKKKVLEEVVEKHPKFKAGIYSLAVTWLQLHRQKEALSLLEKYHQLYDKDPTAEYYLAALYAERMRYSKAWEHLRQAERIVKKRGHLPKALKSMKRELQTIYPEKGEVEES